LKTGSLLTGQKRPMSSERKLLFSVAVEHGGRARINTRLACI
jgi:hypothetical protein